MKIIATIVGLCAVALVAGSARAEEDGQALYLKKCAACHQAEGQGLPHPIPPLAGSPILLDDESKVASLLLTGKDGMPSFHFFLNDREIAAILTYARGAWGNSAPPVSADVVKEARKVLGPEAFRMVGN